jgi:hypothetical protein
MKFRGRSVPPVPGATLLHSVYAGLRNLAILSAGTAGSSDSAHYLSANHYWQTAVDGNRTLQLEDA